MALALVDTGLKAIYFIAISLASISMASAWCWLQVETGQALQAEAT